jgi:glutathione S-transferase
MTNQPMMPNSSVDQRLLGNLRRARLEMEELGLQFEEVLAKFDEEIRQQRLKRIQKSLSLFNE